MSNIALYRKYRPRGFDEVIGQEHVVHTLKNAVARGTIAHAYLFSGPRGTGKTTIARLLAKTINCEKSVQNGSEPCNQCANCSSISEGRALDIIEIDAASNRGIDEIRELREGIRSSPVHLKYKVYIIDEAHQLTKEAFNALLKTLEEPPAHAVFVLATTAADRMPATILSRVQRFDFKKFSVDQIADKLSAIAKREKVKASDDAVRLIAYAAEGGMRDAESMFAQVLARAAPPALKATEGIAVTEETVRETLGIAGAGQVSGFIDLLADAKLPESLAYANEFYNNGGNPEEFLKSTLNYLRRLRLIKVDASLRRLIASELTDDQFSVMVTQAARFDSARLDALIAAFMEAQDNMKKTSLPLLPCELAVIKVLS